MEFNFDDGYEAEEANDFLFDALNALNYTEATIFLVDMQALNFFNPKIEEPNRLIVLKAYIELMKAKVISNPNDKYGLVFYNTVS